MFATSPIRFPSIVPVMGLVFWMAGCMTDPPKEQPASELTSVVATYTVGATDTYKTPDSASWSRGAANGKAGVPVFVKTNELGKEYSVGIELASGLGNDELGLHLWVRGIKMMTVYYKATGSSNELTRSDRVVESHSVALNLIKSLDSSKGTAPAGKAGIDSLLARWILASDPRAKNWKDSLPEGLDVPGVVRSVLVAGSKSGKPLADLGLAATLSISDDSLKTLVLELISTKAIEAKDSAILFPPAPVRVAVPLSVAGDPKAGGDPVKLGGEFVWNDDLGLVVLRYEVKRGTEPSGVVVVSSLPVPSATDGRISLESASIVALSSAQPGEYALVVTAADGNGNSASTSVAVQVLAKDPDQPTAPRIRLLSPADKSTVPFETSEVVTTWIVTTPQGSIDSVTVDGAKADKLSDSTWSAKVKLEPTGKAQTVVVRATNSDKLATTETVSLAREVDKVGPVIEWISPTSDVDVENGVNAITVRLKATDASGIDTVLIAGQKPDSVNAAGEWVRKVPLTVVGSPMSIEVRVVDKAGNASVSSKSVTRANAPTDVPPKTILVDPASKAGTVVPFETKTVTVRWTITDPYGIDSASVTVNGAKAESEPDNKWSATVDLATGVPTSIILVVKNKNGVSGGDVIAVTRKADTVVPSIELVAGSRSVGYDSAEVVVSCKASDNDSLVSVTIGGVVATNSNGAYSAKVKVAVGDNAVIVTATDRTKIETSKDVLIHRYQPLVIQKLSPSGDTTVGSSTTSLPISWKITGAKSVWIGDESLEQTGSGYTYTASLSGASTKVLLRAEDSTGRSDSSVVVVARRPQAALTLSYGLDTLGTLPDSVVIAATSETGASLAWSLDGKTWTPFTGSFVQKTSGTAQVRAQVVGKNDKVASLKAFTLFHANRAPTAALTATSLSAKSYLGTISGSVVKVTDWGIGDGVQTGAWEVQNFDLADTQFVSKLVVDASGRLTGNIKVDTTVSLKVRFRVRDNGGTANGGVDLSDWTDWLPINIVDTVRDHQGNSYRARRMPDGKTWMRSNLRYQVLSAPEACYKDSCEKYGVQYSMYTAFIGGDSTARTRGACPAGWHIAEKSEWTDLMQSTMEVGSSDSLYNLRAVDAWRWEGKSGTGGIRPGTRAFGDFLYPNGTWAMYGHELWVWLPRDNRLVGAPQIYGIQNGNLSASGPEAGAVRCVKD